MLSRATLQLAVVGCWALILPALLRGRLTSGKGDRRRDLRSWTGLGVQTLAFSLSWMGPWWSLMPRARVPRVPWAIAVGAVVLGLSGAVLVIAAILTLGRQWSLTARVLEGHRLITRGPYALVRNPIYTGMWGLQLATALAFSAGWLGWPVLPISAAVYYLGTVLRVRAEEKLLRAEFGPEFEDYARRIPALIPLPRARARTVAKSA